MDTQTLMASLASAASYEVMQTDLSSVAERITVDMDTRKITTDNSKFGNERDHLAKTKVLDITRYVGGMDLSTQTAALHWENGTNGGVYALTEVDLSEDGRMLYKWPLSEEFTQNVGAITFAVHLYTIKTGVLLYHISSDPYVGKIDKTFNATNHALETTPPSQIEECVQQMKDISAAIDEQVANVTALVKEAEEAAYNAALSAAQAANAAQAALDSKADAIVQTASGTTTVVTDSAKAVLAGMRVYGKSTQDGTPSPDAPVEIVSVGDDGSVEVGVYGGNLFDAENVQYVNAIYFDSSTNSFLVGDSRTRMYYVEVVPNTRYTFSKELGTFLRIVSCPEIPIGGGKVTNHNQDTSSNIATVTTGENDKYIAIFPLLEAEISTIGYEDVMEKAMLNIGTEAIPWTPYTKQSLPISRTLPGIPVTDASLATYTDADGQMWCADEVDFERGVYVQRVETDYLKDKVWTLLNSNDNGAVYIYGIGNERTNGGLFTHGSTRIGSVSVNSIATLTQMCVIFGGNTFKMYVFVPYEVAQDLSAWQEWLNNNDLYIQYLLATPIETALTDEELTAYAALHSNYPITSIISDAHTEVDYVTDTKTYVDNKFAELAAAIVAGSEV